MKLLKILILTWIINIFALSAVYSFETLKGMQIGSEDAPVSIIEYRSLTCSHCAEFSNQTYPLLKSEFIDTGVVKFELRPFALNAIDLNAFKLLHCADETDFFALDKLLFKEQKKWIVTNPSDQVLENSTKALGDYGILFGISEDDYAECLNNEEITDFILSERINGVENFDISSTPTFIINGEIFSGNKSFEELEKIILKKS